MVTGRVCLAPVDAERARYPVPSGGAAKESDRWPIPPADNDHPLAPFSKDGLVTGMDVPSLSFVVERLGAGIGLGAGAADSHVLQDLAQLVSMKVGFTSHSPAVAQASQLSLPSSQEGTGADGRGVGGLPSAPGLPPQGAQLPSTDIPPWHSPPLVSHQPSLHGSQKNSSEQNWAKPGTLQLAWSKHSASSGSVAIVASAASIGSPNAAGGVPTPHDAQLPSTDISPWHAPPLVSHHPPRHGSQNSSSEQNWGEPGSLPRKPQSTCL